ncbi:IclR family transcriptional regulator [Fictibacillus sp. Mic-4]|uniref:IclR family transcriptional regulator n=1 Tax=Fictibacillus sp. Mic-4 TaxID=3132826 RepID=UPI003CF48D7D
MVQSIDRAMQIIHILTSDDHKPNWSISEIAEQAELPLSTVHRLLRSLTNYGLVAQVPETKQYKIGLTWMEIGLKLLENMDFRSVARPVMEKLAQEVQESIYLNMLSGINSIIIERVDSPLKVRMTDNLGERIPMNIGAANKTMLAFMNPIDAKRIMDKLLISETKKKELAEQLSEVQKKGYAVSYGEKTEGTASIAAPIIGFDQKVMGAISIGVLSYSITDERLSFLIDKVIEAAEEISLQVGKTP